MNRLVTTNEIEAVIKKLLTNKVLDQMASQVNLPNIQKRTNTCLLKTMLKDLRGGKTPKAHFTRPALI